jgi:hypothetical protein
MVGKEGEKATIASREWARKNHEPEMKKPERFT